MTWPFLAGGGDLGALIARHDWSVTSLGPIDRWSPGFKSVVGLLLRSAVPIVTLWGEDGVMIYNDAYAVFAGGRHPALLGSKVLEGWPEVAAFNDHVMKVGLAGRTLAYRDQELTLYRSGQAEQVWMNLDYSPVVDDAGLVIGVMAVVVETTAKVRAEDRVRGERVRLRQLFEQAPGFIALLSGPAHVFDVANPAYLQLIGHREVLGKPIREALPEVEGQGFFEILDRVFASGEPFSGWSVRVTLQRTPDGPVEPRFVDFVYQPLRDEGNRVVGVFVQGADVTDRVSAEEALRESDQQFSVFAQAMPNQVWAAQPDGSLDWFNERVFEYSGLGLTQLEANRWTDMVHRDDIAIARRSWARALAAGDIYEAEFRLRRFDAAYRWHLARALPIRDEAGNIVRWIGTNTDIEEQKATTRALAELNQELEQRVEREVQQRSDAEEALRHAQKLESIGQLTGGIAHDFNNMLAGIMSSIELVKRRLAKGEVDGLGAVLGRAENSVQRATQLTQRLLAFARRQALRIEAVDVARLLHSLTDMLQRTLGPQIALRTETVPGLWQACSDAAQLESALLNLVINSRDAMAAGGQLTIAASNAVVDVAEAAQRGDARAGDYVVVSVSDTGTGMPADVLERAFDPFYTTKPMGQGTGLGLSMVYGFLKQIDGHVRLQSVVGKGTTVRLYLPRALEASLGAAVPEAATETPASRGETILMVEDDADLREVQALLLDELGYPNIVAEDAAAALAVLRTDQQVDLLLTDVGLPGMNGRQLAEIARTLRPGLPVIFLTGYAEEAVQRSDFLAPGMAMIAKPVALEVLATRIREALG